MAATLNDIIENMRFGLFSIKLVFIVSCLWFLDGSELPIMSILGKYLKCDWNMSSFQTATSSSAAFLGMAIGSVYWGTKTVKMKNLELI